MIPSLKFEFNTSSNIIDVLYYLQKNDISGRTKKKFNKCIFITIIQQAIKNWFTIFIIFFKKGSQKMLKYYND